MLTCCCLASCVQEGDDEEINLVNDSSQNDEETNKFDRIVGALEGQGGYRRGAVVQNHRVLMQLLDWGSVGLSCSTSAW